MQSVAAALLVGALCACACACEMALTHEEISGDRSRAVEFFGREAGSRFGTEANAAGDLNGDGFDDFVISAPTESAAKGVIYVIFGRSAAQWANATFNFNVSDTFDPASWIKIIGVSGTTSRIGEKGFAPGDFNGDGIGDLLVTSTIGMIFCIYGRSGGWVSFSVSSIEDGSLPGFSVSMSAAYNDRYVCNAGDMNGDGIDDLLISAPSVASTLVVFGIPGANRSNFDVSSINGINGFLLTDGEEHLATATSFGSAGDIDGDGLADLVLGSRFANNYAGRVHVLFARNVSASGEQWPTLLNLTAFINGTNGFIVEGPPGNNFLGATVVGAGDVNADGFADLFIGSLSFSGAWVVFGHPAPWESPLNVSLFFDGSNGFRFSGAGEYWGISGGGKGDFNGDGIEDLIIGGYDAFDSTKSSRTGAAAIIFGHNRSWPADVTRNDVVGSLGLLVDGPSSNSKFGNTARGAGDVNGDGFSDFIVATYLHNEETGYAVIVFGGENDDHCAVCSNFTDACLVCDDGFILNGTALCVNDTTIPASSSSSSAQTKTVVVIETGSGGGSATEVAAEIAQLLGVDVGQISVVEITPGTFEVTVINEEVAQQLVTLVTQCIEEASEQ